MPQARIELNAAVGSNDDLPLNVLVQCSNADIGGEITWSWVFLDRPVGSAAAFSDPAIENPTFTPDVEGSYLLKLVVNAALASEDIDQAIAGVRQLKTRVRIPAAGESTEVSSTDGWALAANVILQLVDTLRADPGLGVGVALNALNRADVVSVVGASQIKAGLPGAEWLPQFDTQLGTSPNACKLALGVVEGTIAGNPAVGIGELFFYRHAGQFGPIAGVPAVGDRVYVSDLGALALLPGTYRRIVGHVEGLAGGNYYVDLNTRSRGLDCLDTETFLLVEPDMSGQLLGATIAEALLGAVFWQILDAVPAAPSAVFEFAHRLSGGGPAAIGMGVELAFSCEDDGGGVVTTQGRLRFCWSSAVAGAEASYYDVIVRSGGADANPIRCSNAGIDLDPVGGGSRTVSSISPAGGSSDATPASQAAPAILQFGNDLGPAAGVTGYMTPGYKAAVVDATEITIRCPFDGLVRSIYAQAVTGPAVDSQVFTVRKNAADQTMVCTMAAGATQASDVAHTFLVAAGDQLSVKVVGGGGITVAATYMTATLQITLF